MAITRNYDCNEFLSPADLRLFEVMKRDNPKRYEIEGKGNWGISEGLIYTNWREMDFDIDRKKAMYTFGGKKIYRDVHGMDFGYSNDATTVISSLVDIQKKEIYIYDEIYGHHLKNKEIAEKIKDHGLEKARIMADSADPKSIAELKDLGIRNIKPVKKKKLNGINFKLSGIQMIQDYKIYVHPTCVNTIVELSNYAWDKDEFDKPINKPIDEWDHCLDSLHYSLNNIKHGDISFD